MEQPSFNATVVKSEPSAVLDRYSAVELADLLLFALLLRKAGAVVVEPAGTRHVIRYEQGETVVTLASLESSLADAVVARLALLAGLPVGTPENRLGRVRVRVASAVGTGRQPVAELLLALRVTTGGLMAELHRIGGTPAATRAERLAGGSSEPVTEGSFDAASLPRSEKYRIVGVLGHGGMGIVYRAEHVELQKPVAMKVLHPGLANDPGLAAQFVVEARAACRVRHAGIVDVTDFGRLPDGRAYLVMELLEEPTLEKILQQGPLDVARALVIAREIAAALRAASQHGIVHRDLKPANIFVGADDRVKIGDFGLACILSAGDGSSPIAGDESVPKQVMGTAAYMSPEQGRGEPADARSDLYAFGCVLFEMLTGKPPFTGSTMTEILKQQETSPIPAVKRPEGPVPELLQRIVERALAKRPEARFQSAGELLVELERASRASTRSGWRRWLPT